MASRFDRMALHQWNDVTVLDLGEMDIWDGADLSLLREVLTQLIEEKGCRFVGVNMEWVKYIPSGFFGMLFDWHEKGTNIFLYKPRPHVADMLWFRQFFDHQGEGCFQLCSENKVALSAEDNPDSINGHDNNGHATNGHANNGHAKNGHDSDDELVENIQWDDEEETRPLPATASQN